MYFEEFTPGKKTTTPSKTITAKDVDLFIGLSGLDLPMFMSDAGAREAGHDRRLAPGPLVLSLAMGLVRKTGWFDHVVAVAGFDALRFRKTVHPGDSMHVQIEVTDARPTHKPDQGLVVLAYTGFNQHDDIVFNSDGIYLFRRSG